VARLESRFLRGEVGVGQLGVIPGQGEVAGEEEAQEDVKLLMSRVIEHFGGQAERLVAGSRYLGRMRDGKVINIKYSKRHGDYYWFGLHASLWEDMGKAGATHLIFILLPHGFLAVPTPLVREYLAEANVSAKTDGSVRHYHVLISAEPKLEFFHHGKPGRIPLKQFYIKFES
jgi:hypothetical protein